MGIFRRIREALERKTKHVPIWTPIGQNYVTLPHPANWPTGEPIIISANAVDIEVMVAPFYDTDDEHPTINGVIVFVIPKNEMACFVSNGKDYFATLGVDKWI